MFYGVSVQKQTHKRKRVGRKEVKFGHNKCDCTILPFYTIVTLKFYSLSSYTALYHHHQCYC